MSWFSKTVPARVSCAFALLALCSCEQKVEFSFESYPSQTGQTPATHTYSQKRVLPRKFLSTQERRVKDMAVGEEACVVTAAIRVDTERRAFLFMDGHLLSEKSNFPCPDEGEGKRFLQTVRLRREKNRFLVYLPKNFIYPPGELQDTKFMRLARKHGDYVRVFLMVPKQP